MALRYIRADLQTSVLFGFAFFLGILGLVSVAYYRTSLQASLETKAAQTLGGDFAATSRRELTQKEMDTLTELLPPGTQSSQGAEFVTMLSFKGRSRLVQVRAFDSKGPFRGQFLFENQGSREGPLLWKDLPPKALYASQELKYLMNLNAGDLVQIGEKQFQIGDFLTSEEGASFRGFAAAPTVLMHFEDLKDSPLIQTGASLTKFLLFQFPNFRSGALNAEALRTRLLERISDPQIDFLTPSRTSAQLQRLSSYVLDYLQIAALIALVLSALGLGFLVFYSLQKYLKEIAIMAALGLKPVYGILIFLIRILLMGLIAIPISILTSIIISPLFSIALRFAVPISATSSPDWIYLVLIGTLGIILALTLGLPIFLLILKAPLSQLFSESSTSLSGKGIRLYWILPGLLLFLFFSIFLTKSFQLGGIFVLGILSVFLFVILLGFFGRMLLLKIRSPFWINTHSIRFVTRNAWLSGASFVSITMTLVLMGLLSHVQRSIVEELELGSALPDLFLFDIQDEQVQDLTNLLSQKSLETRSLSPLIRARLLKVNGADFERAPDSRGFQSREDEVNARFRNRGFNLSIRKSLSNSESLNEGTWFDQDPKTPELSIEKDFASRLNLKLGDQLQFDVQGVEIKAKITSIRSVKWTTFDPNFFVLIEPGLIDEAPKVWLASIGHLQHSEQASLQNLIASQFGNISVVNVTEVISRLVGMTESIKKALQGLSLLSVLLGFFLVLISALIQKEWRKGDLFLFNLLGATPAKLRKLLRREFFWLGLSSSFVGGLLGTLPAYLLAREVFHTKLALDWSLIGISFLLIPSALMVLSRFALPK